MQSHADRIQEAVSRNESVVIAARCKVRYSGRAESFLPLGDRIILIKADNTLIVHQPEGNNPINYMKPRSSFDIHCEDQKLFLNAKNSPLKEFLDIEISRVHFLNSHALEDGHSIILNGTEKDMSDMLFDNPELIEKGFKPLSREEHTKYGFIDLFGYDKNKILTVIECKRFTADLKAVDQLRRYVEKVKKSKGLKEIRGIIAAPGISANAEKMLKDWGFSYVCVNPPKYLERHDKNQSKLDWFERR